MDYKGCSNCKYRRCADQMAAAFPDDDTPCDAGWERLPCPFCGGTLSKPRANGKRHCFSCHFEYEME